MSLGVLAGTSSFDNDPDAYRMTPASGYHGPRKMSLQDDRLRDNFVQLELGPPACETYSRILVLRGSGNLQSYLSTTRL